MPTSLEAKIAVLRVAAEILESFARQGVTIDRLDELIAAEAGVR